MTTAELHFLETGTTYFAKMASSLRENKVDKRFELIKALAPAMLTNPSVTAKQVVESADSILKVLNDEKLEKFTN